MSSVDRFKKRKEILQNMERGRGLASLEVSPDLLQKHQATRVDAESVAEINQIFSEKYDFEFNVDVSDQEVDALLKEVSEGFDEHKFENLMLACRKDVLTAVVSPFGLGKIVGSFDKEGGNVTTRHNFEQGITATESDAQRHSEWVRSKKGFNREPYDYDPKIDRAGNEVVNKDGRVVRTQFNSTKKKEIFSGMQEGESITDGYTGEKLGEKKGTGIEKDGVVSLEHITSVKEIETDAGNHLFAEGGTEKEREQDRVGLARDEKNLTLVEGSMNSSKGDRDLLEWANAPNKKDPTKTNAEHYSTDPDLLAQEYEKSKEFLRKQNLKRQVKKQGKEVLATGAKEGAKMGTQQALGLVMCEFFEAVFDEVQDVYKNGYSSGFDDALFLRILKERFERIARRIAARWKDACEAFSGGFISGFLSNLVTVVINMFVRTGKRMVRIIREGFFSLLKAIKLLCFPPEGVTPAQAAHEASKLIGTGLVIAGGVMLESAIDALIKGTPLLEPFADLITTVLVGALTGLAVTFVVYGIDQLDFFKVKDKERHEFVMRKLEANLETMIANGEDLMGGLIW